MFYEKLLHPQILKAQKRQSSCQSFFALSGSVHLKAAHRMLMKFTPAADPIKLFFFDNEEFLCFLLLS
jgi:hypothetical protein